MVLACQAREDLRAGTQGRRGTPDELRFLPRGVPAAVKVLVVDAAEEEASEANFRGQQCRLRRRMTEGVELPTRLGSHAELVHEELVAEGRLVDHVQVVRGSLVMHAPASIGELKLPARDQLFGQRAGLLVLLPPPTLEEGLLDVRERAIRVLRQPLHDGVQDHVHICALNGFVLAGVILIDGLQPTDIIVGVRDNVHGHFALGLRQGSRSGQGASHRGKRPQRHDRSATDRGQKCKGEGCNFYENSDASFEGYCCGQCFYGKPHGASCEQVKVEEPCRARRGAAGRREIAPGAGIHIWQNENCSKVSHVVELAADRSPWSQQAKHLCQEAADLAGVAQPTLLDHHEHSVCGISIYHAMLSTSEGLCAAGAATNLKNRRAAAALAFAWVAGATSGSGEMSPALAEWLQLCGEPPHRRARGDAGSAAPAAPSASGEPPHKRARGEGLASGWVPPAAACAVPEGAAAASRSPPLPRARAPPGCAAGPLPVGCLPSSNVAASRPLAQKLGRLGTMTVEPRAKVKAGGRQPPSERPPGCRPPVPSSSPAFCRDEAAERPPPSEQPPGRRPWVPSTWKAAGWKLKPQPPSGPPPGWRPPLPLEPPPHCQRAEAAGGGLATEQPDESDDESWGACWPGGQDVALPCSEAVAVDVEEHHDLDQGVQTDEHGMPRHIFEGGKWRRVRLVCTEDCWHSHEGISNEFTSGEPLSSLVNELIANPGIIFKRRSLILEVFWVDPVHHRPGHYRVYDNRRLFCMRRAYEATGEPRQIYVQLYEPQHGTPEAKVAKNCDSSFKEVKLRGRYI